MFLAGRVPTPRGNTGFGIYNNVPFDVNDPFVNLEWSATTEEETSPIRRSGTGVGASRSDDAALPPRDIPADRRLDVARRMRGRGYDSRGGMASNVDYMTSGGARGATNSNTDTAVHTGRYRPLALNTIEAQDNFRKPLVAVRGECSKESGDAVLGSCLVVPMEGKECEIPEDENVTWKWNVPQVGKTRLYFGE